MLTSKKTIIKISHFADFEQAINKISHFVDCEQIKKLTAKRPWEKPDAYAFFCFGHPRFYECIGIQFFSSLTCDLRNAMSRQRSHTHMCLTGHHATQEVTYYYSSRFYLYAMLAARYINQPLKKFLSYYFFIIIIIIIILHYILMESQAQ